MTTLLNNENLAALGNGVQWGGGFTPPVDIDDKVLFDENGGIGTALLKNSSYFSNDTDTFYFETRFRTDTTNGTPVIASECNGLAGSSISGSQGVFLLTLDLSWSDRAFFSVIHSDWSRTSYGQPGSGRLNDGLWHTISAQADGQDVIFIVDWVEVFRSPYDGTIDSGGSSQFAVWSFPAAVSGYENFDGEIDYAYLTVNSQLVGHYNFEGSLTNGVTGLVDLAVSATGGGTRPAGSISYSQIQEPTYDSSYQDIIDYWNSQSHPLPSSTIKWKQEDLIKEMKSNNLWSKLDLFYVLSNISEELASTNWISPWSNWLTKVNNPVFNPAEGWKSALPTDWAFLRADYIPSVDAVNFQLADASMGLWSNNFSSDLTARGAMGATSSRMFTRSIVNSLFNGWLTSASKFNANLNASSGLIAFDRSDQNDIEIFDGNAYDLTASVFQWVLSTFPQNILNAGIAGNSLDSYASMAFWAASLGAGMTNLHNVYETFITNLKKN